MKFELYVRAAKHPRFRSGKRIEASHNYNPDPLAIGGSSAYYRETPVHTARFKLVLDVPDELLREADIPTIAVQVNADQATTVTPTVEQEPVEEPAP